MVCTVVMVMVVKYSIPLSMIAKIAKVGGQKSRGEHAYGLEILCKDYRSFRLGFVPANHSRRRVFELVNSYVYPKTKDFVFAFSYMQKVPEALDGWKVYDSVKEFNVRVSSSPSSRTAYRGAK